MVWKYLCIQCLALWRKGGGLQQDGCEGQCVCGCNLNKWDLSLLIGYIIVSSTTLSYTIECTQYHSLTDILCGHCMLRDLMVNLSWIMINKWH